LEGEDIDHRDLGGSDPNQHNFRPEMGVLSIDKGHFRKEKILTTET
jgi:hypothetical protein